MIFRILIISFFTLFSPLYPKATFNHEVVVADLVKRIQGEGITISNAKISKGRVGSSNSQVAIFSNGIAGANLKIDQGILLTTGYAETAFTSNSSGRTNENPGRYGTPGQDTDLLGSIDNKYPIYNQVVLEFDIVLDKGVYLLEVDYQFASEEYPEWVGSKYNDAFGFFISGGDLPKTYNLARANDKPTSITINNIHNYDTVNVNNINNGSRGNQHSSVPIKTSNKHMFIDNGGTDIGKGGVAPSKAKIFSEFDGFTTKLYANMDKLTPGKTYHFKLALADTSDTQWDAGVFINKIRARTNVEENLPSVAINDIQLKEGNTDTSKFTFTVSLDNPHTSEVSVDYTTSNGSATAGDDYIAKSGTVNFAAGETSKTVTILVKGDTKVEPNETFNVTLSEAVNTTISKAIGVGTIINDDTLPTLSIKNKQKKEGDSGETKFKFIVNLSKSYPVDVTVDYRTTNGTAKAGSDYKAITKKTLTIPAGNTKASITVKVKGDTIVENDETFNIILSNPSNASISDKIAIGTILNDDSYPGITINDIQLNEGNAGTTNFTFTVSLDNAYGSSVAVDYATSNVTATLTDNDYIAKSGTVNFAAGETSKTVTILVNGDTKIEPNETFNVTLSNPSNVTISKAIGVGTILNDDFATIGIDDVQKEEGHTGTTDFTFTLTLDRPSYTSVSVDYQTSNDTATTADSDYNAASGTLTIAAGETTATITVTVNGDTNIEPDETFTLTLSSPTNTTLDKSVGTGTIINDDFASISVDDVSVLEGDDGITSLVFTILLDRPDIEDITISYMTQDGTATTDDDDYNQTSGTITIPAGKHSHSITVDVLGDTRLERDEDFYLILSDATVNQIITDNNATGTILNDDKASIVIGDVNLTEGDNGLKAFDFNVTMSTAHYESVTLSYFVSEDTATEDIDYKDTNGTITFSPGETVKQITIYVIGDYFIEEDETFYVYIDQFTETPATIISKDDGLGTIIDDDSQYLSDDYVFNVERTNSSDFTINTPKRNALYTQITGRAFNYSVVSYNKNLSAEKPVSGVAVKVNLLSENNDTLHTDYAYVDNTYRSNVEGVNILVADKNSSFSIIRQTLKGNLLRADCNQKTAKECYYKIRDLHTTDSNTENAGGISTDANPAKDNFAIRPAALYYAIDDDNTSVRYLENNSTVANKKFIAGHEYSLYIRGLSYGSSSDLMDSYNGETNATLAYDKESGTNCSDESNSSFLADGNTTTSFKHSEVGIYTLGLIDDSWTEVDQNDNEDCVVGNAATPKEFNTPPGCNISSDATANSVSNQTFAYVPAKFDLSGISRSIRLGAGKIDNNDTVYMNDLYGAQTPMSIEIAGIIQALAEDDNITVNYTERCRAENLNFSFDLSALATDDINTTVNFDNFLTEDGNRQLVQYNFINIDPDDPKIEGNENNYTIDTPNVNRTTITLDANISADNFRSADTNITLNLNINRNRLEAMNPKRIVFNSIDVNSSEDSNNVHNREINGTNTGLGETTLLYAKVRASQEKYTASASNSAQNTPIQIEVYCTDPTNGGECINPDGTSKHGLRNDDTSSGWWLSTLEGTLNNATDINLTVTNKEFKLNDEDDVVNATNIVVRIPNTTVTADGDMGNTNNANNGLVFTVCPNAIPAFTDVNTTKSSPWVRYGADPLYSLNCQGASDWSGVGNVGSVVGGAGGGAGQAPAVDTHTNDRLSW